jgi:Gamma tubulin complex component C-terminal/Gamma tubulin complex component N-terminal
MAHHFNLVPNEEPSVLHGLLEIPELVSDPKSIWQPFQQASNLFHFDFTVTEKKWEPLPELRAEFLALDSQNEPFPELDSLVDSTSLLDTEESIPNGEQIQHNEISGDLWSMKEVASIATEFQLVNWDTFLDPKDEKARSAYLSEAGPAVFDAVLTTEAQCTNTILATVVGQHGDFLRSLFELGLGRESLLYQYDDTLSSFISATGNFGLSGISFELRGAVLQNVLQMGNCVRGLQAFVAEPKFNPLSVALGSAVSTIFYAMEFELQASKTNIQSILQIEDIFSRPKCLVHTLQNLVKIVRTTECAKDSIIKLMHESERLCSQYVWQAPLLHNILGRVSAPWISAVETEAGLRKLPPCSEAGTLLSADSSKNQQRLGDRDGETALTQIEEVATDSRRCLDILQAQQADHPLLKPSTGSPSGLAWQVSWEGIAHVQMKANEYEKALQKAVIEYSCGNSTEAHHSGDTAADHASPDEDNVPLLIDLDTPDVLNRCLGEDPSSTESSLSQLASMALTADDQLLEASGQADLSPPLSHSFSLSLLPLLNSQSRLLSFSTLNLLFTTYSLGTHLSVQHRFQLLTDGPFASRLSRALFDPDQSTGEGRRTSDGATGLRLQARHSWPPASSELRLVLMGILSESYHPAVDPRGYNGDDLPGNLSFAIRDLSAEELDKCRDASNIEALDFLRLQYKPPPVLDIVITQSSLKKYDKVFKYMLRLLRMQAVAQSLLRDATGRNGRLDRHSQRYRIEIHRFIFTLAEYSSSDIIGVEWSRFQKHIENIEGAIMRGDYEGTLAMAGSLSRLEQAHEHVLDRIIRALFLSRRHTQAKEVMESIFGLILRVAAIIKQTHDQGRTEGIQETHAKFRKQVGKLVHYLRSQGSGVTARTHTWEQHGMSAEDEAPFEHLLIKLDMFGHYT